MILEKVYVVELQTGGWEGFSYKTLFFTPYEYQANFYCSRAQSIFEKYKSYYDSIVNKEMTDFELGNYYHYSERNDLVNGRIIYSEVKIRDRFKEPINKPYKPR